MQTGSLTMARVIEPIGLLGLLFRRATTITSNNTFPVATTISKINGNLSSFSSYSNVITDNETKSLNRNSTMIKYCTKNNRLLEILPSRCQSTTVIFKKDSKKPVDSSKKKKAVVIKKLHKANKDLFGDLLETSKEKSGRVKKESKLMKKQLQISSDNFMLDTLDPSYENETTTKIKKIRAPKKLPMSEQVVEPQGTDIYDDGSNQNVKYQNKDAEINWTLKSGQKRTKVMKSISKNNPSTSSDSPKGRNGQSFSEESRGAIITSIEGQSSLSSAGDEAAGEALPSDKQFITSLYDGQDMQPKTELKVIKISNGIADKPTGIPWEAIEQLQPFDEDLLQPPRETKDLNFTTDNPKVKSTRVRKKATNLLKSQSNEDTLLENNPDALESNKQSSNSSSLRTKIPKVRSKTEQKEVIVFPENGNTKINSNSNKVKTDNNGLNVDEADNDKNSAVMIKVPYFNVERQVEEKQPDLNPNSKEDGNNISNQSQIISIPFPRAFYNNYSLFNKNNNQIDTQTAKEESGKSYDGKLQSLKLPSVSKILNATMPKEQAEALERWQARMIAEMGEEGFRLYKENMLNNGKMLHSNIESYLRGTPLNEISVGETIAGHWNSVKNDLPGVKNVQVLESHVAHPILKYCGIVDCVATFRDKLVVIDWKTSQKQKPFVSMTYDTPLQIAAYIGAINYDPNYSLKIDAGLIVIAYEDGKICQTFLLKPSDVTKYWMKWTERLKLFHQMNPSTTS